MPQEPEAAGPVAFAVPDQGYEDGGFELDIARSYGTQVEADLVVRAEAEMPPRASVIAAIGDPAKQAQAGVVEGEGLWWLATFDGIRIPYAITDAALVYYTQVLDAFRHGDFEPSKGIVMQKASLSYTASVRHEESVEIEGRSFEGVDVVTMSLSWSQYCGGECAMGFHKERTVVFDAAGGVVAVFGDGETPYLVS